VTDAPGLDANDVTCFWETFLPALREYDRNDWSKLRDMRHALIARFGLVQLRKLERVLGRLCVLASGKIDPLYLHRLRPPLRAKNYAYLWMAVQDAIWDGREAFEAMLADPLSLNARLDTMTLERGLFFNGVFRYDALVFESQKLRLIHNFVLSHYTPPSPSRARWEERGRAFAKRVTVFGEVFEFLQDKLKGPPFDEGYPECYPRYVFQPEGVVALEDDSVLHWEPLPGTAPVSMALPR
jgi:hypothetical protein